MFRVLETDAEFSRQFSLQKCGSGTCSHLVRIDIMHPEGDNVSKAHAHIVSIVTYPFECDTPLLCWFTQHSTEGDGSSQDGCHGCIHNSSMCVYINCHMLSFYLPYIAVKHVCSG